MVGNRRTGKAGVGAGLKFGWDGSVLDKALTVDHLVYESSKWDQYNWDEHTFVDTDLDAAIRLGKDKVWSFESFSCEVFSSLFADPKRLPQIKAENAWAERAHSKLENSDTFSQLKERCNGSRYLAGVAAAQFVKELVRLMPDPQQPLTDPEPIREKQASAKAALRTLIEALQQRNENLEEIDEQLEQAQDALEQAQQQQDAQAEQQAQEQIEAIEAAQQQQQEAATALQQRVTDMQEYVQQLGQQGRQAVQAAQQFADRLDRSAEQFLPAILGRVLAKTSQEANAMEAIDISGWNNVTNLEQGGSLNEKMQLAKQMQGYKLQKIFELYGRLKPTAMKAQNSKSKESKHELHGIGKGRDLARLLPSELVNLAMPELFPVFARKYTEGNLLQYELEGKEPLQEGAMVILLDSSGSMQGDREVASKAVILVLLHIAFLQKRRAVVIHYAGDVCRVDEFKAGENNPQKLLKTLTTFFNGGATYNTRAIDAAIELIKQDAQLRKEADIINISDGDFMTGAPRSFNYDQWHSEFLAAQKELNFDLHTILVEASANEWFEKIIDPTRVVKISDVCDLTKNMDQLADLFAV